MTSEDSDPPVGCDDRKRDKRNVGKADVVPLDALRRRARKGEPENDPDPGDDPGPAAA